MNKSLFLLTGLFISGCGGPSGEPGAEVIGVRVAPRTTAQGKPAQMVYVDWKNTGTAPTASVFVDLTIYNAAGATIETAPKQCVYASSAGIAPGETYTEPEGEGYFYVMQAINGDAARATAAVVKVESPEEMEAALGG